MIFVDQLVLTQRFSFRDVCTDFVGPRETAIPRLAGVRRLSYREAGDVDQHGEVQDYTQVIGETQSAAWLHGSHETRIQVKSDGTTLMLAGNPGRFGRPDNIWNYDLDESVERACKIVEAVGFPTRAFFRGEKFDYSQNGIESKLLMSRADEETDNKTNGTRVWSIHLTQNYLTGSPSNLKHVMNWMATQSMRRVTKKRRGEGTLEFGAINYCQTQLYDKAAEMLSHASSKEERAFLQGTIKEEDERVFLHGKRNKLGDLVKAGKTEAEISALFAKRRAWKYAHENGLLRVEVKCAKDFLVHKGLTFLKAWDMGKVVEIFKERTQILDRLEVEVDELDVERLPKALRVAAAAWLAGVDLRTIMPQSTFYRKAKQLGDYGLDVFEKRSLATVRPIMKKIVIQPAVAPDWYNLAAA